MKSTSKNIFWHVYLQMSLFEKVENCNSNKKDKQDNEDGDDDGTNTWSGKKKKSYFNS